ncbi:unnamed protein product, partial [Polarella glacialis]
LDEWANAVALREERTVLRQELFRRHQLLEAVWGSGQALPGEGEFFLPEEWDMTRPGDVPGTTASTAGPAAELSAPGSSQAGHSALLHQGASELPMERPEPFLIPESPLSSTSPSQNLLDHGSDGPPGVEDEFATTLQVKPIPQFYNQASLARVFENEGTYNFLHIPYCERQRRPTSYAFINFVSPEHAREFRLKWHRSYIPWSQLPLTVNIARVQGVEANFANYRARSGGKGYPASHRPLLL